MPLVHDPERVVRAQEPGVLADGRARPPVRVVHPPPGERLDRAVVHVHRDDRVLADRARAHGANVSRRQEVDRHLLALVPGEADVGDLPREDQIDVPDGEIEVAAAAPRVVHVHGLIADPEPELLGERRGHDDERQAVAGARRERLRRIPGRHRVVLDLELAPAVERVEQSLLAALRAQFVRDLDAEVALHVVAQRKDVADADRLRRRGEQAIVEQRGDGRHRRRARASGEDHGQEQDRPALHPASPLLAHDCASAHAPRVAVAAVAAGTSRCPTQHPPPARRSFHPQAGPTRGRATPGERFILSPKARTGATRGPRAVGANRSGTSASAAILAAVPWRNRRGQGEAGGGGAPPRSDSASLAATVTVRTSRGSARPRIATSAEGSASAASPRSFAPRRRARLRSRGPSSCPADARRRSPRRRARCTRDCRDNRCRRR